MKKYLDDYWGTSKIVGSEVVTKCNQLKLISLLERGGKMTTTKNVPKSDDLVIRRINGKYWQAGYRENGDWINVLHLGKAGNLVLHKKVYDFLSTNEPNVLKNILLDVRINDDLRRQKY